MDYKRNLLIAALAIVSYLLLLAWNNDHPPQASSPATTESAAVTAIPGSDVPVVGETKLGSDLPQVGSTITTPSVLATSQLINIETPLQHITIDLLGGDIVGLSLPRYPTSIENPNVPFQLLKQKNGLYIAQSGLIGPNGIDANAGSRPHYQSTQTSYSVSSGELQVDLTFTTPDNVLIVKRYIVNADDYLIHLQYLVTNNSAATWSANLFGQIKHDDGADPNKSSGMRINNFLGAVMTSPEHPYIKTKLNDIKGTEEPVVMSGGWIGFSQHYFLGAWVSSATEKNTFSVRKNNDGSFLLGFVGEERTIAPGEASTIETAFWAGPKNQDRLEEIAPNLGLTIDYGKLWFVAYPIFHLLSWIYGVVGNYGVAIVLLTVVIKTLFYPLSAKQFSSSAAMKRIQPKLAQLKERYADDKQKFAQAQMELFKKEKVNPLSGCLPIFLQMPVFLGIYWVLNESVELRQAPFLLWYKDLSAMDPYFILPILLGAAYYFNQHLNPMPTSDPMQAKMMKFTPLIFSVFFLWFPAGLVLYYLANTLLGIFQQAYFNARVKKASASA